MTRRASTSHLQRRMGIGYNHAARLIDLLEDRGVIGPAKGAGPRDILIDLNTEQTLESEPSSPISDQAETADSANLFSPDMTGTN